MVMLNLTRARIFTKNRDKIGIKTNKPWNDFPNKKNELMKNSSDIFFWLFSIKSKHLQLKTTLKFAISKTNNKM